MKTKFKYFSLVIAALLMVGFASCSSDDDTTLGGNENETKTVTVKISKGLATRTVGPSIGGPEDEDTHALTFTDGHLYFVSATEAIVQHFTIGTEATGGLKLNIDDIKSATGVTVSGIPATAIKAYIVGNYPATGTSLASSGLISRVTDHTLKVEDQNVFEYVNLYGTSDLSLVDGTETGFTTTVVLSPTVARIELGKLTAHALIRGFTVDGIFADNFYSEAAIDGTLNPNNIVDHDDVTETNADGIFNKGSNDYPTGYNGPIYDWYDAGLVVEGTEGSTDALSATPGDDQVWGYNLFAQTDVSPMPRIIIRMRNIDCTAGIDFGENDSWYLTIGGFTNTTGGGEVTTLEPGHIYKIGDVNFSAVNLHPAPSMDPISVEVKVTLADWVVKNLDPVVN